MVLLSSQAWGRRDCNSLGSAYEIVEGLARLPFCSAEGVKAQHGEATPQVAKIVASQTQAESGWRVNTASISARQPGGSCG
jgi:hypothetical protein